LQWSVAEESGILKEWMELHNAKIEDLIDEVGQSEDAINQTLDINTCKKVRK